MRKLVLSVCVGVLVAACDGGAEGSTEGAEAGDAAAGAALPKDAALGASEAAVDSAAGEAGVGGIEAGASTQDAAFGSDQGPHEAGAPSDAGVDGGKADAASADAGDEPQGKPVFVIAGYRSGIAFSSDLGQTWTTVHGPMGPFADNHYVLSAAAFGKGTFVVAGFDIFSSTDGEHWTQRDPSGSEWLGSLNFGNGVFAGAGGSGTTQWSDDGVNWHSGTRITSYDASDTSAFGDGTFMVTTRAGDWWRSADGKTFTQDSGGHADKIAWCADHFADQDACSKLVPTGQTAHGAGVWIRAENNTTLKRSTDDGASWKPVSVDFEANAVTFGYVPTE